MNRGNARQASRAHGPDAALADYDVAIALWESLVIDAGWVGRSWIIKTNAGKARCHAQLARWMPAREACIKALDDFEADFDAAVTPAGRREALESLRGLAALAALSAARCRPEHGLAAMGLLERGRAVQLREVLALDDAAVSRLVVHHRDEFRDLKARLQGLREQVEQPSADHAALFEEAKGIQDRLRAILAEAGIDHERLQLIIKQLRRARFGRRSERIDADQLALGLEDVETDKARAEAAQTPRAKRHGLRSCHLSPTTSEPAHRRQNYLYGSRRGPARPGDRQ